MSDPAGLKERLRGLAGAAFGPLDLLPYQALPEKLLALALSGPPVGPAELTAGLRELAAALEGVDTEQARVVVFGGGTGLANIIGGESRHPHWPEQPFAGLKEIFPRTTAVVCVTDDGGSTGELLKDLPLIALGDLRHVLLASIRRDKLAGQYGLSEAEARRVAAILHRLFNFRSAVLPPDPAALLAACRIDLEQLPGYMARSLNWLIQQLYDHPALQPLGLRPHCLGNLLLAAAIYSQPVVSDHGAPHLAAIGPAHVLKYASPSRLPQPAAPRDRLLQGAPRDRLQPVCEGQSFPPPEAILKGVRYLADMLGASPEAVLPVSTTPAGLKILYENGVLVSGEYKTAHTRRNCPVDRVLVEFSGPVQVPAEVLAAVAEADIILFAPGSLFTSTIPILQVPGVAAAVRNNRKALKMLLANLWVQTGETDLVRGRRERRFHVSDLLRAYRRNVPGGTAGLFDRVLVVGMREIPGSILQSYALENKVPIYLDREEVSRLGLMPLEAAIASQSRLDGLQVLQHDPAAVARAVRVLWALRELPPNGPLNRKVGTLGERLPSVKPPPDPAAAAADPAVIFNPKGQTPDQRRREVEARLQQLDLPPTWLPLLGDIFWRHRDIPLEHLAQVRGMRLVPVADWGRCQEWDNVFSFYDPADGLLKIRADIAEQGAAEPGSRFEIALLVALGQSLLGNYAARKEKNPIIFAGETVGHVFIITMRPAEELRSFFDTAQLGEYLRLARMRPAESDPLRFTRLLNAREGFTPPGLLFGLTYAWYLDNRHAPHIEYKMSITRAEASDLVPEQLRISGRRQGLIDFFRRRVFSPT